MEHTFDHVAKFHCDQPKELGDLALKKEKERKKETAVKRQTAWYHRTGRPNKYKSSDLMLACVHVS